MSIIVKNFKTSSTTYPFALLFARNNGKSIEGNFGIIIPVFSSIEDYKNDKAQLTFLSKQLTTEMPEYSQFFSNTILMQQNITEEIQFYEYLKNQTNFINDRDGVENDLSDSISVFSQAEIEAGIIDGLQQGVPVVCYETLTVWTYNALLQTYQNTLINYKIYLTV